MKHYCFDIANNKISLHNGEVPGVGENFKEQERSFGVETLYYKVVNGKVTEVICEAFSEEQAKKVVNEFLLVLD